MSSIVYSGDTIVNTTFTGGTRAEIVTGLGNALVNAGWTLISANTYKSAITAAPKGNSICMNITDPGSGSCANIKLQNDSGTRISGASVLLPGASKIYRVIACKYNFFIFTPGTTAAREFICGGTLFIPDFLNGIIIGSFGWLHGNAQHDTDSNIRKSFRTRLNMFDTGVGRMVFLRNDLLLNMSGSFNQIGNHNLLVQSPGFTDQFNQSYRWSDDSIGVMEAIFCSGISSESDENKRQGLIHNCMVVSDSFPADTIPTSAYDGHNWWAITDGNGGDTQNARGTLFVATN